VSAGDGRSGFVWVCWDGLGRVNLCGGDLSGGRETETERVVVER
jgi:hypothetical protein